jgi:hypothetical protein
MMIRFTLVACAIALSACSLDKPSKISEHNAPKTSVYEIAGDKIQRVAGVSRLIAKQKTPPTAILDAHFIEEQIGDGNLGPSDFQAFYVLKVAPQSIAKWTNLLTPLTEKADYAAPKQPRDWWIDRANFNKLKFYKTDTLTMRIHGWIGVLPQTGHIYISTFTM